MSDSAQVPLPSHLRDPLGAVVGADRLSGSEVIVPDSVLSRHTLVVGKAGSGKSTFIKNLVARRFALAAGGEETGPLVVLDPGGDLAWDLLNLVPDSVAHRVRYLDFGSVDRIPAVNILDPMLFPDREACVDTVVTTFKYLWEHWGGRTEDILRNCLVMLYDFNCHPDTPRHEMLTLFDLLSLLTFDYEESGGEVNTFKSLFFRRVSDSRLRDWYRVLQDWPVDLRSQALAPIRSRIGAYASNQRGAVVLGQRESSLDLPSLSSRNLILLVSMSQGSIGTTPAALLGSAVMSALETSLRREESRSSLEGGGCLLVCDDFQSLTVDWSSLISGPRVNPFSLMLCTRSLLNQREFSGVSQDLFGVVAGYRMTHEDAVALVPRMGFSVEEVSALTSSAPEHFHLSVEGGAVGTPVEVIGAEPAGSVSDGSVVRAVRAFSEPWTVDWDDARRRLERGVGLPVY